MIIQEKKIIPKSNRIVSIVVSEGQTRTSFFIFISEYKGHEMMIRFFLIGRIPVGKGIKPIHFIFWFVEFVIKYT